MTSTHDLTQQKSALDEVLSATSPNSGAIGSPDNLKLPPRELTELTEHADHNKVGFELASRRR